MKLTRELSNLISSPFISRGGGSATVTICIPTYQSEPFIERTLAFASGQTLNNIRILVSVDTSTDKTANICREFARTDSRIDGIETEGRMVWAGNVARRVRNVDTDFFFMFYHDDVILPQFCEKMQAALLAAPEAASANCEVSWLGETERRIPAYSYPQKTVERVATLYAYDQIPGAPMRNMVRTSKFGSETLLEDGADGMKLHYGFLTKMMIAGPCIAVPDNLYIRWIRKGGLVDGWKALSWEDFLGSWQAMLDRLLPVLTDTFENKSDCDLVTHALLSRARWHLQQKAKTDDQKRSSLLFRSDLSEVSFEPNLESLNPELAAAVNGLGARVKNAL